MGFILTQGLAIGGKVEPLYLYSYALSIDLVAGDANITVTNTDASDYVVQWGDGNDTTQSSGVAATHTYSSDYDGNVIIRSESPITSLSSTDGDWDFNISSLPSSLTTMDFGFAGVAITGAAIDLPASIVTLDLGGSSSVIEGSFEDLPESLTSLDLNATSSTLDGALSDLPRSLTYLDLSSSSITIVGELDDLPSTLLYLDLSDTAATVTASTQNTAMGSGSRAVYLQDTNMASATVDEVLAALATITTWVTEQAVNLGGNNASRSSSSDADKTTLTGNGVTVTVNENSPTYDDVSWIGVGSRQSNSTAITIDFPTHAADDLLAFAVVCRHDDTPVTPSGWTEVAQDASGTTDATSIKVVVYYKIATGAGTTVALSDFGAFHLSRGVALGSVDTTAPVNGYQVTVNSGAGDDVAATSHTFDGVVTTVPKAMVVTFVGFGLDLSAPDSWANGNLASITEAIDDGRPSGDTCAHAVAYGVKTAAGDVGNTTVSTAISVESVAIQVAFTPTSSGGVPLPTTAATLATNQAVGPANLTITTHDASTFTVEWGDGSTSAEIASGGTASRTYASAYNGNVLVHSDGNVTKIESTAGGWDFALSDLPSTLTSLDLGGIAGAAITGTLSQLPSGMEYLLLWGTGSTVTGSFGDEPAGLIDMHLFDSSCVIGGDVANLTSTVIQDITLSGTTSNAVFNIANLPATLKVLRLNSSSCVVTATGDATITSPSRIELQDLGLTTAVVDSVLSSLDAVTAWSTPMTLNIGGNNEGYTPATSSAAVATIEALGVTVTANIIPDGGGEIERVGIIAQYTVATGFLNIGFDAEFDAMRQEFPTTEPYQSQAVSCSGGPWGTLTQADWNTIHANRPSSVPVTGGWWGSYWGKDWPLYNGSRRSECKRLSGVQLDPNTTYYLGFNWYLPDTVAARAIANFDKINMHLFQWHYRESTLTSGVKCRLSRHRMSFGTGPEIDIGPVLFGVWRKMIIETNMGTGASGYVRVWLDPVMVDGVPQGTPVYEYTNQAISPPAGLNMKAGAYYFNNEPIPYDIIHYYNAYFIGNSTSSLASVYPG